MKTQAILSGIAIAVLIPSLAACSSAAPAASGSLLACQHYRAQRAWVKSLVNPTLSQELADVVRFQVDLGLDNQDATPRTPVFADLVVMTTYEKENKSVEAISKKLMDDCTALGVTF